LQGLSEQVQGGQDTISLQSELYVLQSNSVLLQTAERLNLLAKLRGATHKPGEAGKPVSNADITPRERLALIGMIRGGLSVHIIPLTDVVEIHYRSSDPQFATAVVNQLVETYSDEDLRSKFDRTTHVSEWLQKQLDDLKQDSEDAQRAVVSYAREHNIIGTDENSTLAVQTLGQISSELGTAEVNRIMAEAKLREFESPNPDLVILGSENPTLGALHGQLELLQTQRAQDALSYGERNPKLQALDAQIDKVRANINDEIVLAKQGVQQDYEATLQVEGMVRKRLEDQEEETYRLNDSMGQYVILLHQAQSNRDLYDTLQMRLKEASVTAGLSSANITVIDPALVPLSPVAPKKATALLMGLFGGLVCGCALGFMIESIDDRLQTSEEVEKVSMLPSLATIPHMISKRSGKRRGVEDSASGFVPFDPLQLTSLKEPKSLAAEAYRGLRSSLLLSSIDKPPRVIVFTSAFPGEGKTTTTVNCAIVLAQRGERVLLVDADLRRGSLDRVFGLTDKSLGLSTMLTQPGTHAAIPTPLPDLPTLHVLPTGPRPPNPAEMLSSHRMDEQLSRWQQEFDRVVFDTAPVLAVSDTQAMAVLADSVILVVRAGMTRKRALIRARDLLWRINAPAVGVVVNDVDMRLENFYTYRYGMYGYNYGYGYRYAAPYSDKAYGFEDEDEKKGE
jgi:capsular exopolysaccharide synthesis family protein